MAIKSTDLIAGDTKNGRLVVQAIDGRDGQLFWELPLQLDAKDWPWRKPWPMMTLIPSGSQKYLLVFDGVEKEENLFDLRSIILRMEKKSIKFGDDPDLHCVTMFSPKIYRCIGCRR